MKESTEMLCKICGYLFEERETSGYRAYTFVDRGNNIQNVYVCDICFNELRKVREE